MRRQLPFYLMGSDTPPTSLFNLFNSMVYCSEIVLVPVCSTSNDTVLRLSVRLNSDH